jgi:dolichol-phosphate mannosyltransferase
MKLSVIIPVYNEEATIKKIIGLVKKVKFPRNVDTEIIVVNDASTDGTSKILSRFVGLRVFNHKINSGKGTAVRTGIENSKGDCLVIQDADLEYDPKYIPLLLKPIIEGRAKVVYGTRLKHFPLRIGGRRKTPLISHFLGNKFLSLVTGLLYSTGVSDMETGYKMFTRDVVNNIKLHSKRFELEPEITAKILKQGIKIYEVPIKVAPRGYDEGKKITWRDGFIAIWTLIKYRFTD